MVVEIYLLLFGWNEIRPMERRDSKYCVRFGICVQPFFHLIFLHSFSISRTAFLIHGLRSQRFNWKLTSCCELMDDAALRNANYYYFFMCTPYANKMVINAKRGHTQHRQSDVINIKWPCESHSFCTFISHLDKLTKRVCHLFSMLHIQRCLATHFCCNCEVEHQNFENEKNNSHLHR